MATKQPALRAYSVIRREGQDDFWQPLGAAFSHSGPGYNLILQALPLPDSDGICKIVLIPPKDEDDRPREGGDRGSKSTTRRR